ncbi:MAG: hypothetical protein M0P49_00035 [Bacilli bacterium]|nr:hypothetical protein [Bacilli bacterium]
MSKITRKEVDVKDFLGIVKKEGKIIAIGNNGLFPSVIGSRVSVRVSGVGSDAVTLYVPNSPRSSPITVPFDQVFILH